MSYVDPFSDDLGPVLRLSLCGHEHRGDDTIRNCVELFDGGSHGSCITITRFVAPGPNGTKALMGYHTFKKFLKERVTNEIMVNQVCFHQKQ